MVEAFSPRPPIARGVGLNGCVFGRFWRGMMGRLCMVKRGCPVGLLRPPLFIPLMFLLCKTLIGGGFLVFYGLVSWRTASGAWHLRKLRPRCRLVALVKGAGRESWLRSRNGTSIQRVTVMRVKSLRILGGSVETAGLRGGRANRRR